MDKRPIGYQPGKGTILDKKIPKTHKYDHVESKYSGKIGTTVKDVEYMSMQYYYIRCKRSRKEKGIVISKDKTFYTLENAEPISQIRIYLSNKSLR